MPRTKTVFVIAALLLLSVWAGTVEYRLHQATRRTEHLANSAEVTAVKADTALKLILVDEKQLQATSNLLMEMSLPRYTPKDIVRQRGKILALPPEERAKLVNLIFDSLVKPALDKSLTADQLDAIRRDWTTRFLTGKDVGFDFKGANQ